VVDRFACPEQFLHCTQVAAFFQQMRRKRVPQPMRMQARIQPQTAGVMMQALRDRRAADALAATADDHRLLVAAHPCQALAQPQAQRLARLAADRQDARARALAGDADFAQIAGQIEQFSPSSSASRRPEE